MASPADLAVADAPPMCAHDCPPCDGGAVCFPGGSTHAVCLTPCRTAADCAPGLDCRAIEVVGNYLPPPGTPTVCASTSLPAPCVPGNGFWCSDTEGMTHCIDDMRLGTGFVSPDNFTCGFVITACPNGCVSITDGGAFPHATCK